MPVWEGDGEMSDYIQSCPACGEELRFETLKAATKPLLPVIAICNPCGAALVREGDEPYRVMTAEEEEHILLGILCGILAGAALCAGLWVGRMR